MGVRLGKETPRIFTPPARELTPETSLGFECISFAEDVLGITLYPWQKWLLVHALELNVDGSFRFRKIFVLVGRQNGKSTLLQVLSLWRMYVDGSPLILGTAQDRNIAREQWSGAVSIAEGTEELAAEILDAVRGRGYEKLSLKSGERYEIAASNGGAGRGLSVDLLLMDELREHKTWDAWAAVSKTTNARPRGQTWCVSNAGDAGSIVLRHFRKQAHMSIGDPDGLNLDPVTGLPLPVEDIPEDLADDDSLAIFEWSAEPGCSVWDREGWAQANPSMGHGAMTERMLGGDARSDPEWVFRTEVLCQWFAGSSDGPFPAGAWLAGRDDVTLMAADSRVVACVDVSWDRSQAHIAFAGYRPDGKPMGVIVATRAGTDWVIPWLLSPERTRPISGVVWQVNGAPVSSLTDDLHKSGLPLIEWQGQDLGRATGMVYDLVRQAVPAEDDAVKSDVPVPGVYHPSQPLLDIAANTASMKPSADAWLWDRAKSSSDISPLVAFTGAVWGLVSRDVQGSASVWEDEGYELMVM